MKWFISRFIINFLVAQPFAKKSRMQFSGILLPVEAISASRTNSTTSQWDMVSVSCNVAIISPASRSTVMGKTAAAFV